jgi:peptidoglycan/LPS O-acetylase OafA/YrhL
MAKIRIAGTEPRLDLPLLDALRILASIAVVRHHMRVDFLFGVGFGLPLFLVVMFGLAASSSKRESLAQFTRRKASYLLVPWLRWSAIYIAILAAVDVAKGLGPWNRIEGDMIFYGGNPCLWFLPFAAAALFPLKALQGVAARWSPIRATLVASAVAVFATTAVAWALTLPMPDLPVRAWLRVSPAIFWGLAVAQSTRARDDRQRASMLLAVALLAILCGALSPFGGPPEDLPRRFAFAIPIACVGFGWRIGVPDVVRRIATATFGIYLVHPLIGKTLGTAFDVFSWPAWAHTAIVWCLALVSVWALRALGIRWHELFTGRVSPRDGARPELAVEKRAA